MEKIAVITGATSGIGKEFSRSLAKKGYSLILLGRREQILKEVANDIEKEFKVKVDINILDITNKNDLDIFIDKVSKYSNIEFLINNAGHGAENSFTKDNIENQIEMIDVHVVATVKLTYAIANIMKKNKKGYIINLSSLASFNAFPTSGMYCGTKSFLTRFSECLALELLESNIKVQALCPGFTRTDFHEKLEMDENKLKNKGLIRWMMPEEVVDISLKNIEKNLKVIVIPGLCNKVIHIISKMIPRIIYYKVALKGWKLLD